MNRTTTAMLLLLCVGCQSRLKDTRTVIVEPGGINTIRIDGPKYDQQVQIEFSSESIPVSVYVCLRQDEDAVAAAADVSQPHPAALGRVLKQTSGSLEVRVPAKKEFSIIIVGGLKPTAVSLKTAGK